MNDKDAKELIKQLQRMNKNLEKLTEAVNNTKDVDMEEVILKILRETNPTYAPEPIPSYPIDPYNPYKITCDNTTTGNPPYYGTKVDTTTYGVVGADWTNKDSLEALN